MTGSELGAVIRSIGADGTMQSRADGTVPRGAAEADAPPEADGGSEG